MIEVGDLQTRALLHRTLVGSQLTEQQFDQGRFAGTVRADQGDAVAAQYARAEIAHQRPAVVAEGNVFDIEHPFSGILRLRRLHLDIAGGFAPLRALAAHRFQAADTAFIAGAARFDALPDPDFFLRQQFVETGTVLGFVVLTLGQTALVIAPIAGPGRDRAAVDFDDAGGQILQKTAVMGDEQQTAFPLQQGFLQPIDGFDIEVVGRFVEQKNIRLRHQSAGQQDPPLHAAGKGGEIQLGIQTHALQCGTDLLLQIPAAGGLDAPLHFGQRIAIEFSGMAEMVVKRQIIAQSAQPGGDHIENRTVQAVRDFLLEPCDFKTFFTHDTAVIGLQLAGDELQQSRFTGTVAADQGDALTLVQAQADLFQQQRAADAEIEVVEAEQRHGGHRGGTGYCRGCVR